MYTQLSCSVWGKVLYWYTLCKHKLTATIQSLGIGRLRDVYCCTHAAALTAFVIATSAQLSLGFTLNVHADCIKIHVFRCNQLHPVALNAPFPKAIIIHALLNQSSLSKT